MNLKWTTKIPKIPGYYWAKHKGEDEIILLQIDKGELIYKSTGMFFGIRLPKDLGVSLWAGPIKKPIMREEIS